MLSCQKHGVKARVELMIDERHLEFALKVGNCTQSLDDDAASLLSGKVRQKRFGMLYLDVRQIARDAAKHVHPLGGREHGAFAAVDHHTHDKAVKAFGRAADDIEMAVGDRIKAARVNCCPHTLLSGRCLRKMVTAARPY